MRIRPLGLSVVWIKLNLGLNICLSLGLRTMQTTSKSPYADTLGYLKVNIKHV